MEANEVTWKEKPNEYCHWTAVRTEYLTDSSRLVFMTNTYLGLAPELVLDIHRTALILRKEKKLGQRNISRKLFEKYGVLISESTIAGWLYQGNVPYANSRTQFKPKPIPAKDVLHKLYVGEGQSANKIGVLLGVSTIIVINWLRHYSISPRTHLESMQLFDVKKALREKARIMPTKEYSTLTSEKAYVLEVLCGDGYIDKGRLRLEIRYDKEFAEEFKDCIEKIYGGVHKVNYYAARNTFIVDISREVMCSDLFKYGVFDTWNWIVPKQILNSNDVNIMGSFVKGVFDSEGHVEKYGITMLTASKNGADNMITLLSRLGITAHKYKSRQYAVISITHWENMKKFSDLVGFNIRRKQTALEKSLNERKYHVQVRTK